MERRQFMQQALMAGAALTVSAVTKGALKSPLVKDFPVVRIPEGQRRFKSKAVEALITKMQQDISNKELAWMFGNCFPNTLDTTVEFNLVDGKPDTYVITGDIDAMWLRDSSAQVWPYLPLCREDKDLQQLVAGVIHRQARNILLDPYANAFYKDSSQESEWKKTDITDMKPGIHERKWEIDSLCYP
ncbi:MAG TPA: glycoside hydrolase family 125 protein, partial [Chitinophaga sp.]